MPILQRGKSFFGKMSKTWTERYVIADPDAMLLTYKEGSAAVSGAILEPNLKFPNSRLSIRYTLVTGTRRDRAPARSSSRRLDLGTWLALEANSRSPRP